MVNKPESQSLQGGPPPIDESWWTALLAEEEGPRPVEAARPASSLTRKETRSVNVDWDHARLIYQRDEAIKLKVTGFNRGGLLVEGPEMQGFVPISHLVNLSCDQAAEDREQLLNRYLNTSLLLKVIECDPARGRVVLSERAALSMPGQRTALLETLQPGERIWGQITNITNFGVFVDLGGLEGLVHVSELSWGRVRSPADVVQIGERLEVYVLSVDRERLRVALSVKQLIPNPWETAEARYQPGQVVKAVITTVMPFGAFAQLEEGLDGLIHVSEMDMQERRCRPEDLVHEGQCIMVRVMHVDASRQRLGLSMFLESTS